MADGWDELRHHHKSVKKLHLRHLFEAGGDRAKRFSLEVGDLFVDYSKHRITPETIRLLIGLARESGLEAARDDLFAGKPINVTEQKPALHVALRNDAQSHVNADGVDVMPEIRRVLGQMQKFAKAVHDEEWKGATGKPIKNIINIGIGGSELGPHCVYEAFRNLSKRHLCVRFLTTVDQSQFNEVVRDLNRDETLFIISSKSFKTGETLANAKLARDWLGELADEGWKRHMVAVSDNQQAVADFGLDLETHFFEFWDWVGGRFSLSSAIGLVDMIALGPALFMDLLRGMHEMDEHFRSAPLESNLPVVMGMLSVWYNNFFGCETEAVVPYGRHLARLPAYLQQLSMESNGKSVQRDGSPVTKNTAPIVWGTVGTDAQHSFFQLLHQGTKLVPVDFIGPLKVTGAKSKYQQSLLANMLAQSEALAFGQTDDELRAQGVPEELIPHKRMFGNRPSTTILMSQLSPFVLGQLIALYEHKAFVQGVIWNINSFDQWGVELGKTLANNIEGELRDAQRIPDHDSSTMQLMDYIRDHSLE